jgi:uncharacterized membrane protein YkvA (DUF1232 family)
MTVDALLLLGLGVLVAYAAGIATLLLAGRRVDARAWAGFVPDCLVLARRLLSDARVPRRPKLLLGALAAYLALPIDIVPDFLPVVGQLDDAIIVALVLRTFVRDAGAGLIREHWPGPDLSLRMVLRLAGHRQAELKRAEYGYALFDD